MKMVKAGVFVTGIGSRGPSDISSVCMAAARLEDSTLWNGKQRSES